MSASKYHATPTTVDGIRFASRLEARRYGILKLMERTGEISGLVLQKRFPLMARDEMVGEYVADFVYRDEAGRIVIEDAKGVLTPLCRWKFKHMAAQDNPVTLWPPRKVKTRKKKGAP